MADDFTILPLMGLARFCDCTSKESRNCLATTSRPLWLLAAWPFGEVDGLTTSFKAQKETLGFPRHGPSGYGLWFETHNGWGHAQLGCGLRPATKKREKTGSGWAWIWVRFEPVQARPVLKFIGQPWSLILTS